MNSAISISSNNETSTSIEKLWDKVGLWEDGPSMRSLNYPPHITFGIFENVKTERLDKVVKEIFGARPSIKIRFEAVGYFDVSPLVLWVKPRDAGTLFELHERIHNSMKSVECHEHYAPGAWVPHCTLSTNISKYYREDALAFSASFDESFDVIFDTADWVSFPPVKVAGRLALEPSEE